MRIERKTLQCVMSCCESYLIRRYCYFCKVHKSFFAFRDDRIVLVSEKHKKFLNSILEIIEVKIILLSRNETLYCVDDKNDRHRLSLVVILLVIGSILIRLGKLDSGHYVDRAFSEKNISAL